MAVHSRQAGKWTVERGVRQVRLNAARLRAKRLRSLAAGGAEAGSGAVMGAFKDDVSDARSVRPRGSQATATLLRSGNHNLDSRMECISCDPVTSGCSKVSEL